MKVYNAPGSELNHHRERKRETLGKIFSWLSIGSLLPIIGTTLTVIQMIQVFQAITLYGAGDPKLMAGGISESLVHMVLFIVLSLPSFICIFVVLFLTTYRSKVLFRLWVLSAVGLLLSLPLGTPLGLVLGITLFIKRKEFRKGITELD